MKNLPTLVELIHASDLQNKFFFFGKYGFGNLREITFIQVIYKVLKNTLFLLWKIWIWQPQMHKLHACDL